MSEFPFDEAYPFTNVRVDRTTGQTRTFNDLVESMRQNGWVGDPIDVVRMRDGVLTTIDNTRLLAARKAGINVQARIRSLDDALTPAEIRRFTETGLDAPKSRGEAIRVRVLNQEGGLGKEWKWPFSSWGHRFPNGSLYDPIVR